MRSGNPFAARSGLWWLTFALLVVCGVGGQTAVHLATGKSFVGALLSSRTSLSSLPTHDTAVGRPDDSDELSSSSHTATRDPAGGAEHSGAKG